MHIDELQNKRPEQPVIFIKPNVCICEEETVPLALDNVRYEGELSFLLKNGKPVAVAFGVDFTAASEQEYLKERGLPWEKAKAFRNSAVFGVFVKFQDLSGLSLELHLNGELKQKGGVAEMLFAPATIIEDIAKYFDIEEGDILMCGTPSGVGQVKAGDVVSGKIMENGKILTEKAWEIA